MIFPTSRCSADGTVSETHWGMYELKSLSNAIMVYKKLASFQKYFKCRDESSVHEVPVHRLRSELKHHHINQTTSANTATLANNMLAT